MLSICKLTLYWRVTDKLYLLLFYFMLLFAVLLVTLLALLVSFILYVLSTANANIAIAINILMQCIYIYMLTSPPKIYLLHPFVSQISTRKLFAQLKRKTEKKKTEKSRKNNRKTKRQNKRLWGNSGWDISLRVLFFLFVCFFVFFGFFRFRVTSEIFLKKHVPLPAFNIHYFFKKTVFPKIFPAIYFKRLSLKTGLFQREVISKDEFSIWTNRPLCRAGFFLRGWGKGNYMNRTSK